MKKLYFVLLMAIPIFTYGQELVSVSNLGSNVMDIDVVKMVPTRHTQLAEINQETVMEIYSGVIVASASNLATSALEVMDLITVMMGLTRLWTAVTIR